MGAVASPLTQFQPAVARWFDSAFSEPTRPQVLGWPAIARRQSTLIFAPTGTGKTLAAFLACIDRLMFEPPPPPKERCRVLYVSPLKALAVDVERNLRSPLVGIARLASERGDVHHVPSVGMRTGDTPQLERTRFARSPSDILITTPESLYLLLTSRARDALRSVDTVIIDEIHALVPGKRGAHLALSLERLEALTSKPLQRIGLSATQHPLDEVARFLGGAKAARPPAAAGGAVDFRTSLHAEFEDDAQVGFRPVEIVDARGQKNLSLTIDVPVEDMSSIGELVDIPSGPAAQGPQRTSIWQAIHPRLLELIQKHTSTLIFVNSRRIAERLAGALNELAGETVAYAHHGSLSREQRSDVEDRLKAGKVKALVATSSLELGIDMGAIDLVVQIEAPPTVASGLQRIGRAGHSVGLASSGVIFPKYRGDLLACAALTRAMLDGAVETTRYPRNPLDVLAQQIVAMVSLEEWRVDDLFELVRRAAPFAELSRGIFESVLDMLAGRYASDDFAELKPRITWDRVTGVLQARQGAQRIAIANGGTIPDRGLYGVFLAAADRRGGRIGELDEEMVFESKPGDTFVLGASTWRIDEITFDKVLVTPAPGEPGRMPFWRGEAAGRSLELGQKIGALTRELGSLPENAAVERLRERHGLDPRAGKNLVQYLADQRAATRAVPDDKTLVIERCRDELGDYRVCVLSPLGGRVHAAWSMAAVARVREQLGIDVESMWTDDGFVVRFPEQDDPPDPAVLIPAPEELETLLIRQLGQSALFAARFRENASRALLLPRRRPGQRTPLWLQRKRAADLLAVAAQFTSFPILLETYRECLRDVFDLPALHTLLRDVQSRTLRVVQLDSDTPSPFSSTLLFGFVANYIYDGDAPLAERRAQALSIDQAQLRELLGEAELRDLLDADALTALEAQLQLLDPRYKIRNLDALHDALLRIGDLDEAEIAARCSEPSKVAEWTERLTATRRALWVKLGSGEARRLIAVEDAARFRDALGVVLPPGLPDALLAPAHHPLRDLLLRYARTHAPFTVQEVAARYGLGRAIAQAGLTQLVAEGKLHEGAFRPGGIHREYVHAEVLRTLRQRSLAKLRKEVEPVEPPVFGRFCTQWHGMLRPRAGLDAILDAVEKLQGVPLPASILESEILRARVLGYRSSDLDSLSMAGEIVWCGREPLGERDGRISLYLTDHFPKLWVPPVVELDAREQRIVDLLAERGASFFAAIQSALGGFPGDALDTLWGLVWKGVVTNDTFRALRAHVHGAPDRSHPRRGGARGFRSRRQAPRAAEGRWSLVRERSGEVFVAASSAAAAAGSASPATERAGTSGSASTATDRAAASGTGSGSTARAAASALTERAARSGSASTATDRAGASGSASTATDRATASGSASTLTERASASGASTATERAAGSGRPGASAARAAVSGRLSAAAATRTATERSAALAETLLQRYGVVTREVASAEGIAGGFSAVYDVFKALEEAGRIRRGYFVSGVSAMQFALPGVLEQLRALRRQPDAPEVVHLAATDPANPYGALLKWPEAAQGRSLARAAHALVILIDGALAAYLARGGKTMQVFLPEEEPDRTHVARALAARLKLLASTPERGGLAIAEIDGQPAEQHPIGAELREAGFLPSKQGFYLPRSAREQILPLVAADGDLDPGADSDAPEAENA